jgi:TDG/mug DNA glycosylase family protein
MNILFVSINPHPGSFRRGIPFSNNKTFWYLLNRAGVIKEKENDLRNDKTLKNIYETKFNQKYNLGLLNVVNRPTIDATSLKKGEEVKGRKFIHKIIKRYKPKVVCFIGRTSFEKFSGIKIFDYGWSSRIYNSKSFIMHFPIRGEASIRIRELKEIRDKLRG